MEFEIGDLVVGVEVRSFDNLKDSLGLGLNSDMKYDWTRTKKIVRIRTTTRNGIPEKIYELDDSYVYNEDWIKHLIPKKVYHDNPRINKVISKIKLMEKSRKEKGYAF